MKTPGRGRGAVEGAASGREGGRRREARGQALLPRPVAVLPRADCAQGVPGDRDLLPPALGVTWRRPAHVPPEKRPDGEATRAGSRGSGVL